MKKLSRKKRKQLRTFFITVLVLICVTGVFANDMQIPFQPLQSEETEDVNMDSDTEIQEPENKDENKDEEAPKDEAKKEDTVDAEKPSEEVKVDSEANKEDKEVGETIDLSENGFAESIFVTENKKVNFREDKSEGRSHNDGIATISTEPPFTPNSYGVPIKGFNQVPSWIKRLPANKQNDPMYPAQTIPLGLGTATKLNSNMKMSSKGIITFTRQARKKVVYGDIVRYTNDNAGYIDGRAIKSTTVVRMTCDSSREGLVWLGSYLETLAVAPATFTSDLWGLCFVSMHPNQFSNDGPERSKPLNYFVVDVEVRYKDTNQIVDKPLDILVADLDIMQEAYYMPESMHFDDSVETFYTYDRTQLRYNSTSPMPEFNKGFVGTPSDSNVGGTDSIFLRGGHAKTRNGKFRVGFTECNCSTFLNVGAENYTVKPTGKVKVKKTIASDEALTSLCPEQYSLEGAEYTVYKDSGCTNKVGVLKTGPQKVANKGGKLSAETNELELDAGTYYVKETKAPKGYELNLEVSKVTVTAGKTATVNMEDYPYFDPMTLKLQKKVPNGHPEFQKYLEGAEYTVRYYPQIYNSAAELDGKKPLRTWVFRTDSNGEIRVRDKWKCGGDELFKNELGTPVGLIGTYTFEETKAPSGFIKNSGVEIRHVKQGLHPDNVTAENAPVMSELPDDSIDRKITINKRIPYGHIFKPYGNPTVIYELSGTDIYGNKFKLRKSITLDESSYDTKLGEYAGSVVFNDLPAGEYEVREISSTRYMIAKIFDVSKNGNIKDKKVKFELVNSSSGEATYRNIINNWSDLSHMTSVVNVFESIGTPE